MEKVITLKKKTNAQVVMLLEDLLEGAKKGETTSLIYIDKDLRGHVGMGCVGEPCGRMVGAMEEIKFQLFSQQYLAAETE